MANNDYVWDHEDENVSVIVDDYEQVSVEGDAVVA